MEGSGRDLIWDILPEFAWGRLKKITNTSVRTDSLRVEIILM
jgi:hypothetical protein